MKGGGVQLHRRPAAAPPRVRRQPEHLLLLLRHRHRDCCDHHCLRYHLHRCPLFTPPPPPPPPIFTDPPPLPRDPEASSLRRTLLHAPSRIHNEQIGDLVVIKGLSSRKVGATSIHSESSQSHIVFTCVIESWCKDEGCLENTDEELFDQGSWECIL